MGPEREVLAAMLEPRTLDDGEFLCRQGNTASEVFLLAQGCLEVTRADGTPLHRLAAGEVLGELALFTDARRNADVRACGAVRLYVLDYQRFRRFLHAFPLAFEQLMRAALRRVLP
jgi:CRP-like cAMP-binding protein